MALTMARGGGVEGRHTATGWCESFLRTGRRETLNKNKNKTERQLRRHIDRDKLAGWQGWRRSSGSGVTHESPDPFGVSCPGSVRQVRGPESTLAHHDGLMRSMSNQCR